MAALAAGAGCASQPKTAPEPVLVRLDASRGRTWNALTYLVGTKWALPTSMADSAAGLIKTRSLDIARYDIANCPWQAAGGNLFVEVNMAVRGDSTHSTVEFEPTFRKVVTRRYDSESFVCTTTQRLESEFATDLKARLAGQ